MNLKLAVKYEKHWNNY